MLVGTLAVTWLATAIAGDSAVECLEKGDSVGVFYVTKVAGAEDDGVKEGQELCYRCRYGSRPLVMVFTRETGGKLPELVKTIDAVVGEDDQSQLRGLVTFLGDDVAKVKEEASKFAGKAATKHVPVVIAKETQTGPKNYKLGDSPVTIVVAVDSQVVATHRCAADEIDIRLVMGEVKRVLN
jgi:hypothetical protein